MRNKLFSGCFAFAIACGGQPLIPSSDAAIDTQAPIDASAPDTAGEPPPKPDADVILPSSVTTFAIQTLFLGDTDRLGNAPNNLAWESYGYDLDGLVTITSSTNVCTLVGTAPLSEQVDGEFGIDNAFGATILPILQSIASEPTPSKSETARIDSGVSTLQIQVVGLSDAHENATGLVAQVFSSGTYGTTVPSFDESTDWPVLPSSLKDGQTIASGANAQFSDAYVSNGTFVSGVSSGPVTLDLTFAGTMLPITIHDPIVTFDHTAPTDATNGTIAGVIDATALIASLKMIAGEISLSLCGSNFDGVAQQIQQAQEILIDGSNAPNVACTGISIGIGFTAKRVANPTKVATPVSPPPNPCGG